MAWLICDSMDNRVVTFSDNTSWRLTKKLSEKQWKGSATQEEADWAPSEAHAVYECVQVRGPQLGKEAIVKVRIEVPYSLPPSDDPGERAKAVSGMRLNAYTEQEIETLQRLTAAGCSVTPSLLAVHIGVQDESLLNSQDKPELQRRWGDIRWWMPGGYIVYILMTKLPGQSLESFWDGKKFTLQDRNDIRNSFRKAFLEVSKLGIQFYDTKLQNIMWDSKNKKCYLIDFEDTEYDPNYHDPEVFTKGEYFHWNLARSWAEPNW